MKKLLTILLSSCLFLASLSCFNISAAENELTINGSAKVKVGDKIKYTLYLADTTEDIIGFEMRLFYGSENLKVVDNSLELQRFDNFIFNPKLEGKIPVSWTNVMEGESFSEKDVFLSIEFEVVKEGEAEISQFITEIYGEDMTYLKSFTWTYDLSVGDKVLISGEPPLISEDSDTLKTKQGGYTNYIDGMGELNSPNKSNHDAVVGTKKSSGNKETVDVTKDAKPFPIVPVVIIVAVIVILAAAIGIVVIRKKDNGET